ncbi:MAG: winged helix-turn-helix transcriptional regulator [Hamadaea sp.]|nr:winged helix-turn-helix transcriptional regulator [Hamadaea sp.]
MDRDELNERVYQCLQEIGVMIDDGDRGAMRDAGLTPAHFNLLRRLDRSPLDPVSAGQAPGEPGGRGAGPSGTVSGPDATGHTITRLAELTLCTRGNVTRLVQRLVDAGLVDIRSDRSDQRLVRVFLNETGAAHLAAAERGHVDLNTARFGEFTDGEAADLLDRLSALAVHLRKHLADR